MQTLTLRQAKAILVDYAITINWKADAQEYRVNFKGGREASAYYSNDLDDALRTGIYMSQTNGTPKSQHRSPGWTYAMIRTWRRLEHSFGALGDHSSPSASLIIFTDKR